MKNNKNLRFGIDLGIGSVGWAILSERKTNDNKSRCIIEDLGVRVFDSSENSQNIGKKQYKGMNNKNNKNQERRAFRSKRRLSRRKSHRAIRLDYILTKLNIIDYNEFKLWQNKENPNIYQLRLKGLNNKLSNNELAACIKHLSNHRGYREFYENEEGENKNNKKEKDNQNPDKKKLELALFNVDTIMKNGNYRTPAEMICKDKAFLNENSKYPQARNKDTNDEKYIIRRELLEQEYDYIMKYQRQFYPILNDKIIKGIKDIIFAQRDFETGPGNEENQYRKYKGFIDSLGKCMFYTKEQRAFRYTPIADIFAVINNLSQYKYFNSNTGETIKLSEDINKEIIHYILLNASINHIKLNQLLKNHNIKYIKYEKDSLSSQVKYLRAIKGKLQEAGYDYNDFISEEQFDINNPSKLFILGNTLSSNITPKRRKAALEKLNFYKPELYNATKNLKCSGTANVSVKFMLEAIEAFIKGEIYGDFQARKFDEKNIDHNIEKKKYLPLIDDPYITINPVVYRAVNETRKIINALIRRYGSPSIINIEIASDMSRSFKSRKEIEQDQRKRQKINSDIRKKLAELYEISEAEVRPKLIERYKLYEEQGGKCLYSGKDLYLDRLNSYDYEIDHIIPYSLILDNTLNNKALVYYNENKLKGQRVPLMYLEGERKAEFISRVKAIYLNEKNKEKYKLKYQYLMLETIYGDKAINMLNSWKSRNINDTRYIAKYIINFIEKHLQFDSLREDKKNVYGIRGGITSFYRNIWLDKDTWAYSNKDISKKKKALEDAEKKIKNKKDLSNEEKDNQINNVINTINKTMLKELDINKETLIKNRENNLHHAIDAIIIANLSPAYVEIALDRNKLDSIAGKYKDYNSSEYQAYLKNCINKMRNYYGFSENKTYNLLFRKKGIPSSFLTDIKKEVNIRLNDENKDQFIKETKEFYYNIDNFADNVRMPLVSAKLNHRFRGNIQISENALKIRRKINDCGKAEFHEYKKVLIDNLKEKDIDKIVTKDTKLIKDIENYYSKPTNKLSEYLKDKGYNIKKLTIDCGRKNNIHIINKGENNKTVLDVRKYYCVEIYKNKDDKTGFRAIRYIDIVKDQGKLYLNIPYPNDYKEHVMYLRKNDYIVVEKMNKKNKIISKEAGYYQSIKSINEGIIYIKKENQAKASVLGIVPNKIFRQYHVDPLGYIGGEIKCSGLSLSPKVNG